MNSKRFYLHLHEFDWIIVNFLGESPKKNHEPLELCYLNCDIFKSKEGLNIELFLL